LFLLFTKYFLFSIFIYLVGSFPTGKLVGKIYGKNIESEGSGNVGATNISRVIGKRAGILTLLVDITKGYFGVALAIHLGVYPALGLLLVVLGHCYTLPFLKGGKGVATSLGGIACYNLWLVAFLILIFSGIFKLTKIVSLAAVSAALSLMALASFLRLIEFLPIIDLSILICVSLVVIVRHKDNITRIIHKEEKAFQTRRS
jgi:acyl phosphate:glycerol-3-phosphate acyltransferase